ncbi:uncharacterized protein G2W53_009489 [Senna tora]|uniref:Uncharacterized protein n=1 Tax=Senna tora TaxID=362788 RepID=A0A835CA11_9FABA|nr:uncharacterized protein G2W53_009489 [Senna tora]
MGFAQIWSDFFLKDSHSLPLAVSE